MLTLSDYLERVSPLYLDGVYDEEYEVARILYRFQRKATVILRGKRSRYRLVGNLIPSREALLRATLTDSETELYTYLNSPPPRLESAFTLKSFEDHYEKAQLNLEELGFCKYYEKDGGWYINSGIVIARVDDSFNASVHRLMFIDNKRMAIRIVPRHLYHAYSKSINRGEDLPVTILLGSHPLYLLLASNSPPLGVYEFTYLPLFTGERAAAAYSPAYNHLIPIGSSIVIEARVTRDQVDEGPYLDALLTYDEKRKQPIIEVDEIWQTKSDNRYLHALLPGSYEHTVFMGTPREASIWFTVSKVVPRVHKVRLTHSSGGWLHAIISITKNHDADGKNAILAAFAGHPSLKHAIVVDDDIDPDDLEQVDWAIATRFQADRGLIVIREARGSTLDPSAINGTTSKMGIDATVPVRERQRFERGKIPGL